MTTDQITQHGRDRAAARFASLPLHVQAIVAAGASGDKPTTTPKPPAKPSGGRIAPTDTRSTTPTGNRQTKPQ